MPTNKIRHGWEHTSVVLIWWIENNSIYVLLVDVVYFGKNEENPEMFSLTEIQTKWPGGKMKGTESPEETVRRECLEETGLRIRTRVRLEPIIVTRDDDYHRLGYMVHRKDLRGTLRRGQLKDENSMVGPPYTLPLDLALVKVHQTRNNTFHLDLLEEAERRIRKLYPNLTPSKAIA